MWAVWPSPVRPSQCGESMTTSGTKVFNPDLSEIMEEAFERCGIEMRTGYDFRTARRSMNLMIAEWANRGINLWTIQEAVIPLIQNVGEYILPPDTVDVVEVVIRSLPQGGLSNYADLTISRISLPTYASIPNKFNTGRPIQFYVDRRTDAPVMYLWPLPQTSDTYTMHYWRLVRMDDAGSPGTNTIEVPFRFYEAFVAGLAYRLAVKKAPERADSLKMAADEAFDLAAQEDRQRAPLRFIPRMMQGQ